MRQIFDEIDIDAPLNTVWHCGGGPTNKGPIPIFQEILNPADISFLKRTRKATFCGAFGHTGPKYDFAFTANLDFTASTPTELGRIVNDCFELAANDPKVFEKYDNRFMKLNQPRVQLSLPGIARDER